MYCTECSDTEELSEGKMKVPNSHPVVSSHLVQSPVSSVVVSFPIHQGRGGGCIQYPSPGRVTRRHCTFGIPFSEVGDSVESQNGGRYR